MTTTLLDEICPGYIGEPRIVLSLTNPDVPAQSFQTVLLDIDYSGADDIGGIVLPLELTVTPPTISGFTRSFLRLVASPQVAFFPQEAGDHTIVLREVAHNRVYGSLVVPVTGEKADPLLTIPRPIT